ncbi:DNA ligase [Collimonas humicola]|uniref:DNA ligase n=1 Tax=Collimonas humicola TaxID=2825886 RepID=UPI001B8AAE24|nr:DNA ligase [Collimonas humicola]
MSTPSSVPPCIARQLSALLLGILLCLPDAALSATPAPPPLMLANLYHPGISLADYWVSEKLDGVRGYWDGEKLLTRGGQRINAPPWFTANWPKTALDGELWAGRRQFSHAVSTVRRETPDDAAWRRMRFMVFDLPAYPGTFDQRLPALQSTLARLAVPWVLPVEQIKLNDHSALQRLLRQTVRQGGEGLMLHRGASLYRAQRSDDLLKIKTHEDAEAKVIGHLPGKGKYQGMLGALLVETPDGLRFKLGSGFSDAQRRQPPALGSVVTYRFRGLNDSGIPRFASFMRVYEQ